MLRSELHCQKVFELKLVSYKSILSKKRRGSSTALLSPFCLLVGLLSTYVDIFVNLRRHHMMLCLQSRQPL